MAKAKKSPVDRGKLLVALECCIKGSEVSPCVCDKFCPYGHDADCCDTVRVNALAYIYYLEEQLEEAGICLE